MSTLWGRLLQVDLTLPGGTVRLVDYDSRKHRDHQGLACEVEFTRHVRPEPQPLVVRVYNLSPTLLGLLTATVANARNQSYVNSQAIRAGRLLVRAGSDEISMRVICDDLILHVSQPQNSGADVVTEIEAEDGRLLWDNLFVDAISPVQGLAKVGTPPATPNLAPPLANYTANTQTLDTQALIEALGYMPVMQGDTVVWLPIGGTLSLPPVNLDTVVMPPISPADDKGNVTVSVIYDSRFTPGLLATLQGLRYSMDSVSGSLATNVANGWTAQLNLRATV